MEGATGIIIDFATLDVRTVPYTDGSVEPVASAEAALGALSSKACVAIPHAQPETACGTLREQLLFI
ncbi:MAG TPA: hypothetical protein VF780_06320, partial [Nitrosospira sp.]